MSRTSPGGPLSLIQPKGAPKRPTELKVSLLREGKGTYSLPTHESQHRDGNMPLHSLRQPGRPVPPAPRACALHSAGTLRYSTLRSARPPHTHQHPAGSHTPPRAPNTDPGPRALTLLLRLGRHLGQAEAERGLPHLAARAYTPKSRGSKAESASPRDTFKACR